MGRGPIAPPNHPPHSGGLCPGQPHLVWFEVGVQQHEKASATGLAGLDAPSHLLTWPSLRSLGGPGVRSRLFLLVGPLYNGRVAVSRCFLGYCRRRLWCIMVPQTCGIPFLFPLLHAGHVWRWPASAWSVCGQAVVSAAIRLVHGCVRPLVVGLFIVGSLALQPALAHPDVVVVVVMDVSWFRFGCPVGSSGHCAVTEARYASAGPFKGKFDPSTPALGPSPNAPLRILHRMVLLGSVPLVVPCVSTVWTVLSVAMPLGSMYLYVAL